VHLVVVLSHLLFQTAAMKIMTMTITITATTMRTITMIATTMEEAVTAVQTQQAFPHHQHAAATKSAATVSQFPSPSLGSIDR
jgi:hypothetical protein